MRKPACSLLLVFLFACFLHVETAQATVFGEIQGIVHDPQHRPIAGATVVLKSATSAFTLSMSTDSSGAFRFQTVPFGEYAVTVSQTGFATFTQPLSLASATSPILHFELSIATVKESVAIVGQPSPPTSTR